MMFAQVNSEHCRHKIFNASWDIDGKPMPDSLFGMIRNTYKKHPEYILSAYSDNAAVLTGPVAGKFMPNQTQQELPNAYDFTKEEMHMLCKVETHNHPTAVSPYEGAATGSGGEIRDEGAVGCGSKPKAGLVGFTVSHLDIPGDEQPWERESRIGKPDHLASSLDIMTQGPLGGAAFNNEFGRPSICGYFRTFCQSQQSEVRGYHKPIMIAGGMGNVRPNHILKRPIEVGSKLVVLGGPSMLIGLGGGAASSMASGASSAELDFASVQRENPEMERRCQEVIDRCCSMDDKNPVLAVHDVGAGGLSNALPELVHDSGRGAIFQLRSVPCDDPSLSPMEIWCNESQERYVCAVRAEDVPLFESICRRERCPFAVVGEATEEERLVLVDGLFGNKPIDLPMSMLFSKPPRMHRVSNHRQLSLPSLVLNSQLPVPEFFKEATDRVLRFPCVASKQFLITIGDRSVTGLVARDQMVGKWQVPVADCGVTATSYDSLTGEAMAMGERTPLAVINAAASAKMALAESLLNLVSANVDGGKDALSRVRVSANWMASAAHEGEGAALYDAVRAVGIELCPELGVTIPVGKDSMSMKTQWDDKSVTSPVSLIVTAYGSVKDIRRTLTPELKCLDEDTVLVFFDLASGKSRMGGSVLAQAFDQLGNEVPNVDNAQLLKHFFNFMQWMRSSDNPDNDILLAYHDRSDGGLLVTVLEMAFASRCGLNLDISSLGQNTVDVLFNEELGAVVQVKHSDIERLKKAAYVFYPDLSGSMHVLGSVEGDFSDVISISSYGQQAINLSRSELHRVWAETSYRMQARRDDPECAKQEYDLLLDNKDPGQQFHLTFNPMDTLGLTQEISVRPPVAILREQGVNGHVEMAYAFYRAGFTPIDVHMSDLFDGSVNLDNFKGLVACGGFSYGDVLGAGSGWAKSILLHNEVRQMFREFFQRPDTFSLGVCNGCQMLSQLKALIAPSGKSSEMAWPRFVQNKSDRFEARSCMVEVVESNSSSIWFNGMIGTRMPIAVSHGEGRTLFANDAAMETCLSNNLVAVRYVDHYGKPTETFPRNPNGSPFGITGLTSADGRVLIMMPHPERVVRNNALSWHPTDAHGKPIWSLPDLGSEQFDDSPWMRMFRSVRRWVG